MIALSFACGVHFAVVQTCYFFLLEAYLSSRSASYFVVVFFWLTGLLAGLALRGGRGFTALLAVGVAAYYGAFGLARAAPFHPVLYPFTAVCAVVSGLLPGFFFRFIARRCAPIRRPLFHENNGFLLGLAVSLKAATGAGRALLALGPLVGALIVLGARLASRDRDG